MIYFIYHFCSDIQIVKTLWCFGSTIKNFESLDIRLQESGLVILIQDHVTDLCSMDLTQDDGQGLTVEFSFFGYVSESSPLRNRTSYSLEWSCTSFWCHSSFCSGWLLVLLPLKMSLQPPYSLWSIYLPCPCDTRHYSICILAKSCWV